MAIQIISKLKQKNNGIFKLMDAQDVSYDGTENVSVKDQLDKAISKVIYFVIKDATQGIQEYECPFPYNGQISSVSAIYKADYNDDVLIDIEKANPTERNLNNWASILSEKLTINNSIDKNTYKLSDTVVNANDIFRINILNNNININSLTVNIEIIIK